MEKREGGLEMQSDKPWNMCNTQSRYRQTSLYTKSNDQNYRRSPGPQSCTSKEFHPVTFHCTVTKAKSSRQERGDRTG